MDYLTFEELPAELQNIATYKDIAAKQIIFQQEETSKSIYFLLEGQLRLVSFTQERIINHLFIRPGESFAEVALFADTYLCTAIADIPSRLAVIDKEVFHQALRNLPDLATLYINQLIYRFKTIKTLLDLRSIRSARERLLHYLLLKVESSSRTLVLQHPLKDMAIELGLSTEALSRTLARLQEEGMITRKKRSITLNEDWLITNND
ncbi:MAG: Crp/Fnr family transcriptional regulator [Cyanobacteria bacterium P01_A01_bin.40]